MNTTAPHRSVPIMGAVTALLFCPIVAAEDPHTTGQTTNVSHHTFDEGFDSDGTSNLFGPFGIWYEDSGSPGDYLPLLEVDPNPSDPEALLFGSPLLSRHTGAALYFSLERQYLGEWAPTPVIKLDFSSYTLGELGSFENEGSHAVTFTTGSTTDGEIIDLDGVRCLNLDGEWYRGGTSNQYNLDYTDVTVIAWIHNPTLDAEETLIAWGKDDFWRDAAFTHGTGSSGAFGNQNGPLSWDAKTEADQWTCVAWVYDYTEKKVSLFLNGQDLEISRTFNNHAFASNKDLSIGGQNDLNGNAIGAKPASFAIAELEVYTSALSSTDIRKFFLSSSPHFQRTAIDAEQITVTEKLSGGAAEFTSLEVGGSDITQEFTTVNARIDAVGGSVVTIEDYDDLNAFRNLTVESTGFVAGDVLLPTGTFDLDRPNGVTEENEVRKHLVFLPGGRLLFDWAAIFVADGSITRAHGLTFPIFFGACEGAWELYDGTVTYDSVAYGSNETEQPSIQGKFNQATRDITMWDGYRTNFSDTLDACINSLPSSFGSTDDRADRTGTIVLPRETLEASRPVRVYGGLHLTAPVRSDGSVCTIKAAASFQPDSALYGLDGDTSDDDEASGRSVDYLVVFVPRNRNNQSRVNTAGGGGDGKSMFYTTFENIDLNVDSKCNGVLLHASSGSLIANSYLYGGTSSHVGWRVRASDDFEMKNLRSADFGTQFHFTGSCINIDMNNSTVDGGETGIKVDGVNRLGALSFTNINFEGCETPFHFVQPVGIAVTNFTAQSVPDASPVAIIDVRNWDSWPNYDCRMLGSVSKGFDRIRVTDSSLATSQKHDDWRILTRRKDNRSFTDFTEDTKWGAVNFDLNSEFGPNSVKWALEPELESENPDVPQTFYIPTLD